MDSLPLSFGKVARSTTDYSRIASTQRAEVPVGDAPTIRLGDASPAVVTDEQENEFDQAESGSSSSRLAPSRMPVPYDEDDEDDDNDGESAMIPKDGDELPVSHEIIMKDHTKTVSALSIDPSGTRVVSGSYDYDAKLWDFGGMNSEYKPFRSWEIKESHQIHDLQFSLKGDSFLAATGTSQPKLYSRDGIELLEFIGGDKFIRDLRNTSGHVAAITSVAWHPKNTSLFMSASEDSTIRVWDISNKRKSKSVIVVNSKNPGGRTKVTACAWSKDGKFIAGACDDGSIHIWVANSTSPKPKASVLAAHTKGTVTSSIVFSNDGTKLATRGGDDTVKLWDTRSFKTPLFIAANLPSLNPETNLIFSPDEKYLLTGTAGGQAGVLVGSAEEQRAQEAKLGGEGGQGKVVVLRTDGLEVVRSMNISSYSVVRVLWNSKINQILTGSSDGSIRVLYSPLTSLAGATLAVTRAPKRRTADDLSSSAINEMDRPIMAPHTLPMYKEEMNAGMGGGRGGKRQRERERHDPVKSLKPLPPIVGRGSGGRVGTSATQHVVQGLVRDNFGREDPREALLKYADGAPATFTAAWTQNQPKPIFDLRPDEADEDAAREENKRKKEIRERNAQ